MILASLTLLGSHKNDNNVQPRYTRMVEMRRKKKKKKVGTMHHGNCGAGEGVRAGSDFSFLTDGERFCAGDLSCFTADGGGGECEVGGGVTAPARGRGGGVAAVPEVLRTDEGLRG